MDTDPTLMALLDRVAQRDETALKSLYDLTSGKLYGLALRVLERHEWAFLRVKNDQISIEAFCNDSLFGLLLN